MNDYNVIRARFIEWCKVPKPKPEGWPQTVEEFAIENDVSQRTLYRYLADPEFKKAVATEVLGYLDSNDVADIIFAIKQKAKKGDVRAAEWLFKQSGIQDAVNPPAGSFDSSELDEMTEEELAALAEEDG